MEMLWRIFYTLHLDYRDEHLGDFRTDTTDWKEILSSKYLQLQFEEKCAEAGETEVYFLLSRSAKDSVFIERATLDLFGIRFTCESTLEPVVQLCR